MTIEQAIKFQQDMGITEIMSVIFVRQTPHGLQAFSLTDFGTDKITHLQQDRIPKRMLHRFGISPPDRASAKRVAKLMKEKRHGSESHPEV